MKSGVSWTESIEYFDNFTLTFSLLGVCKVANGASEAHCRKNIRRLRYPCPEQAV